MPDCILCGTRLRETECDSRQEWCDYAYGCPHCGCGYGRRVTFKCQSDMVESDKMFVDVPVSKDKFKEKDIDELTDNQREKLQNYVTECLIDEKVCPVAVENANEWLHDIYFSGKNQKAQKKVIAECLDKLIELYPDIFKAIDLSVYKDMVVTKICKSFHN